MKNLKIIFMGTPVFSVGVLEKLIDNYNVVGVVTQPDKEVGRGKEIKFSPIKNLAIENNIEIIQPKKIRTDYDRVIELNPDLIITCAYGQLIPKVLLDFPRYGCINVHGSLLPKLRGGAPIHKAIMNGYNKTGITIMYMSEKMDAGDILSQKEVDIEFTDTTETLHDKLSKVGAELLIETLPLLLQNRLTPIKQKEEEVTFGFNITKEEEKLNFNKTALEIYNQIRGLNSWPGAYFILNNKIIKVYESIIGDSTDKEPGIITNIYKDGFAISCKDKEIILTKIKPEGKKLISVKDYLNGVNKDDLLNIKTI